MYASYADIFQPQSAYATADGAALKPKIGDNYELGIKGEWFDGRLNSSLALFRAIEKNGAETDYTTSCATSADGLLLHRHRQGACPGHRGRSQW